MSGTQYGDGRDSVGCCDRCGQQCDFLRLLWDTGAKDNRLKVCDDCYDEPDPYRIVYSRPKIDPQVIRDPRPGDNTVPYVAQPPPPWPWS
jgi:hypothetical protein